jgi:hypothetical protein
MAGFLRQASPETHRRIDSRTVRGDTERTIQPPPVTVADESDEPALGFAVTFLMTVLWRTFG